MADGQSFQEKIKYQAKLHPDGRLSNSKMELTALAVADGLKAMKHWRVVNGFIAHPPSDARNYSRYLYAAVKTPGFMKRVEILTAEREIVLAEPIWGEVKWDAMTLFRIARETNDLAMMAKGADILFKVAAAQAEQAAPDDAPTGRVGKPSNPTPLITNDRSGLRDRLAKMK